MINVIDFHTKYIFGSEKEFSMDIQKRLSDYITTEINYWDFSGVVRVVQNGKTLFETSRGYSNIAFDIKNDMTTRFTAASIAKQFTAFAIMLLYDCTKRQIGICPPICSCPQTSLSTICYPTHPDCTTITTLRMIFMCTRTESLMIRRNFSKNGF